VDIIVWKENDPVLLGKFLEEALEEASKAQPKDKELKEMAQEFKKRQEFLVRWQKKTKEIEEIRKELSTIETKKVEDKPVITSPVEEKITEGKRPEGEKQQEEKVAKKE
jgi:hypothetical protein